MTPIRLKYDATPLRLAASLGSDIAWEQLPANQRKNLDDAFEVLMSCSDVATADDTHDFGPPRFWPYTLEAALRMAIAAYRAFLPDWKTCFRKQRNRIPANVPEDFAFRLVDTIVNWIVHPESFSWDEHDELYRSIKDDVCLDGYLTNDYPDTPNVVAAYCYGSLYLIDIENSQFGTGPMLHEYNPKGIYAAGTNDAIGVLLLNGMDESRIRRAIQLEVIPWCLGESEPLK